MSQPAAAPREPLSAGPAPGASSAYAHYVLGLLLVAYVFNFVDRNLLAALLEPIQQELAVSDTKMGLLIGTTFALFYTVLGIPIARLADLGNRSLVLAAGLALWSGMTALSGLARGFGELALARVGVGVGEAAGSPTSHSLISDYFPPRRRARALSIYATGNYLGLLVAQVAGTWVAATYSWRVALVAAGLPGLFLALLVQLTVREPARGQNEARGPEVPAASLREALRFLSRQRSYTYLNAAGAFSALLGYGFGHWGTAYLMRVHDMALAQAGGWIGVIAVLGGASGALLSGVLVDRLARRDARWYLWMPGVSALVTFPFSAAFALGSQAVALSAFGVHAFLHALYVGPMYAAMQGVAPLRMRALVVAIHMLIVNLIGLGLGPVLVGLLNDALRGSLGQEGIRYSLLAVSFAGPIAGVLFLAGARSLRQDLRAAGSPGGPT
jgi:MFS family permease